MAKMVVLKRKNWQSKLSSKLQNIKNQVFNQCLPIFSKFFSSLRLRKKQEKGKEISPSPSYSSVTVTLPEDLEEEILHRILAVKSLVRFKSVSKKWRSLIESSHFAEKHLRLRQKTYGAEEMKIVFKGSRTIRGVFHVRRNILRVPGSCNGLVCVYDLANVFLINPMTNVKRKLTPPRGTRFSVGFGRDVVTGTYKVAVLYRIFYDKDDKDNDDDEVVRMETMVFDLGTNEWRWRYKTAGPMPFPCDLMRVERNPVFVKGSVFWLLEHHRILVMNLHTERFSTISQPRDIYPDGRVYMWSLEDRLCVSDLRRGSDLYVWVLMGQDEVNERWERSRLDPGIIPPLMLNSAWYSQSLLSPYH